EIAVVEANPVQRALDGTTTKVGTRKVDRLSALPQPILHGVPEVMAMRTRQHELLKLLGRGVDELIEARFIERLNEWMLLLDLRQRGRWLAADAGPGDQIVRRGLLAVNHRATLRDDERFHGVEIASGVAELADECDGLAGKLPG